MSASSLWRSTGVNQAILAGLVFGWLLLAGILVWLLAFDGAGAFVRGSASDGARLAFTLLIIGLSLIGHGGACLLGGLWAWAGLRAGNPGAVRRLHLLQLVAAVPGVLLGLGTIWLIIEAA